MAGGNPGRNGGIAPGGPPRCPNVSPSHCTGGRLPLGNCCTFSPKSQVRCVKPERIAAVTKKLASPTAAQISHASRPVSPARPNR